MTQNKTTNLIRRFLQVLALFIFAANWFSSANASFLCVCSDGHIAIENIYSSECHQIEFENHDNTATQISSQHDCQDVSLFSDGINSNFNHFKNIQVPSIYPTNNFIKTSIHIAQDQSYLSVPFIRTDNKLRLFTDSVRLII